MRTYYYKKFLTLPRIFNEKKVPAISEKDKIVVQELDADSILVEKDYIDNTGVKFFHIKSFKSVSTWKIRVLNSQWKYEKKSIAREEDVNLFLFEETKVCIVDTTKEAYKQLESQANSPHHDQWKKYLSFNWDIIDLNAIVTSFDKTCIVWLWINVPNSTKISNLRIKWYESVNDSAEAKSALGAWWEIIYIKFIFNDSRITLHKDYRISFWSIKNIESDMRMIEEIVKKYEL